jgi:hypothetical protein
MSDWRHADIVLDQQTATVYEYVRDDFDVPVWNQLSPPGPYDHRGDLHKPILLCRYHGTQRLPSLDLEGLAGEYPPARCLHEGGATWAGKCIDCGAVCAPNLDDEADHEPVDSLLPYFGGEDERDGAA